MDDRIFTFKGQYTLSDLRAAHQLHSQRNWLSTGAGYLLVGIAVLVLLLGASMALFGRGDWTLAVYAGIFLAAWAIVQFVVIPHQIERIFRQRKDYSAPFTISLNDRAFEFKSEYGSSRVPWQEFVKWIENKELLLLYRSDQAYHMLPKRILGERGGIEYARERLAKHKVPVAGRVQNRLQVVLGVILVIGLVLALVSQIAAR